MSLSREIEQFQVQRVIGNNVVMVQEAKTGRNMSSLAKVLDLQ